MKTARLRNGLMPAQHFAAAVRVNSIVPPCAMTSCIVHKTIL
jgi:hypothetical protein